MGEPEFEGEDASGSKVWIWILVAVLAGFCLIGIAVVGIMAALTMPAMLKAKQAANKTKCSNNLRQLGLGAIQYADDKRFYPHVGQIRELDGDALTNDGPRALRTLYNMGYLDPVQVFVCPSSQDMPAAVPPRQDQRTWFWDGDTRPDVKVSPISDELPDPALIDTSELSYGWTRRGFTRNLRSTQQLAADRAIVGEGDPLSMPSGKVGNHTDGANVVLADASVNWIPDVPGLGGFEALLDDGDGKPALGLVPRD